MIQAARFIGTGLATTGLIGAGVGIGVVFGALILGVSVFDWIYFIWTNKGCGVLRALLERAYVSLEWGLNSPSRPHNFSSLPIQSDVFTFFESIGAGFFFINFNKN